MKIKLIILFVLPLLLLAACGDFEWLPEANPNVDTTPNEFKFNNKCAVELNSDVVSDSITITGINSPTIISIVGGEYSIDNNTTFTAATGTITKDGQTVKVRPSNGKITTSGFSLITLNIGGVSASFPVSTDPCFWDTLDTSHPLGTNNWKPGTATSP